MPTESGSEEAQTETTEEEKTTTEGGESSETTETQEDPFKFEDDGEAPTETSTEKKGEDKSTETTTEEDEIDPEDKKAIKKVVDEGLSTIKSSLDELNAQREATRVNNEWNKYVTDYPELKNFAPKILRYATHPTYKGKPVIQAIMDVAGVDIFVKIGSKRAKEADTKAKDTSEGGNKTSTRSEDKGDDKGGTPSFVGMGKDEIYKHINAARQAGRK